MRARVLLGALVFLLIAAGMVKLSAATFTARSTNKGSTFSTAADWVAPALTLTSPANGSVTNDSTPGVSGAAGASAGDAMTVTARLFSGSSATGEALQTRSATRSGATWTTTATTLADGTYTAQATQPDSAGNTATTTPSTFTVDTVAPTPIMISTANAAGGTPGYLDAGDSITYTYSEPITPTSVLSSFTGTSASVMVRFFNIAPRDGFTVLDGSAAANVNLDNGTVLSAGVDLLAQFVKSIATIPATMTRSADGKSFTVVLGTVPASALPNKAAGANNMSWRVKSGPKDRAGNALTVPLLAIAETDGDVDF
jgi:hypothetical protein